ncbi:MAG TPA: TIGR04255 family protein [Methylocella sp.]|nr:TIGR04255 family protein [Methylocella sp.]
MMYDEICYEKPFLKEAIARIDFIAPLEGLDKALPPKLARVVSTHFQVSEPTEAIAQQLQLSGEGVSHHQARFKQWNFFGKEREKQLTIAAPWVFVTYNRYTTFEDMKEQFAAVVEAVGKAFPDAKAGRFGLRYINLIEISDLADPTSWGDYIAPQLLGTMAFFTQPRRLTRLIQVAELKYDDLDLRFQFGMPNPDYPATMKRPQFVLDIDVYVQTAHDLGDSLQHMEQAHGLIQDLFERSVTNRLRERMNARRVPVQD